MNLGIVQTIKGLYAEAISSYEKLVKLYPESAEAHWNMANLLLLTGNFRRGWEEYMWLWKTRDYMKQKRTFSQPSWTGSDIEGRTILLYSEYGFGDTIQFIRYAPLVAGRGATVVVECQKELTSLLQKSAGVFKVIPDGAPLPDFDLHCSLMMLPAIFNTTIADIPVKIPYLTAPAELSAKWRYKIRKDHSKIRIGLNWSGVSTRKKFCSLDTFAPFAELAGVSFYSLQKGKTASEARIPPKGMKLYDFTREINDFSDTAALIDNLDLVISIDTSVAHLTGAMGKPIWTLLPFVPDWRWLLNREDSPWYPTMKLFRQPEPGDWDSVIFAIKSQLQANL